MFNEVQMATRDEQRQQTAARVLDAADRLFRAHGFVQTTIRDIADACDVSVGTVMSAGDKNALLVACFDRRIAEVHDARFASAPGGGSADAAARILGLLEPFIDLFVSDPELARTYGSILVSGAHESAVFTELAGRLIGEIAEVLRDSPDANDERIDALAEGVYFAYIGRLYTWNGADPAHPAGPAELRESLHRSIAAICGE